MFFANIGPNLAKNINSSGQRSVSTYLKHVFSSFEFKTIDVCIVKKTIKELSYKNRRGHDTISTNFLERIADIIAEPLKLIINQSLCTEIFPHRLKLALAKIVPLFKKGDPHILDNYHPISILSAFSKVPEKVVFHQTYAFLTGNKLLYSD